MGIEIKRGYCSFINVRFTTSNILLCSNCSINCYQSSIIGVTVKSLGKNIGCSWFIFFPRFVIAYPNSLHFIYILGLKSDLRIDRLNISFFPWKTIVVLPKIGS